MAEGELIKMMLALYAENPAASPVDQSRFSANVEFLVSHPQRGRAVLFRNGPSLCGDALLIPYWSDEFSGTLLFVDEIFVTPGARNKVIGRSFLEFIDKTRPFDTVALAVEVSPGNARARRLYESLGFRQREISILTYGLTDAGQNQLVTPPNSNRSAGEPGPSSNRLDQSTLARSFGSSKIYLRTC
jgi:GNAT superfamily N-acetyltransferase